MSTTATVPPVSTLATAPDPSDTGAMLAIIIAPSFFLVCIIACMCGALDNDNIMSSSESLRLVQATVLWMGLVLMMFSIGLGMVHTAREGMFDYYVNQVVPNWQKDGGQAVFQNMSTFYLSAIYGYYDTPLELKLKPRLIPVVPTGNTQGVPRSVYSVVQEVNISHSLFRNYSGSAYLEGLVAGGFEEESTLLLGATGTSSGSSSSSSSSSSSDYAPPGDPSLSYWNRTVRLSMYCTSAYCTSGCKTKKHRSFSGSCLLTTNSSKMRSYCTQTLGGVFTPSYSYRGSSYCSANSNCGTCVYTKILLSTCFCVSRDERRKWTVLAAGTEPCLPYSELCGGEKWIYGGSGDSTTAVSVRLMSREDPGLLLAQVTGSSDNFFPQTSKSKYQGAPATAVGITATLVLVFFFVLIFWGEEIYCCHPDSRVRYFLETGEFDWSDEEDDAESNAILGAAAGRQPSYDGASESSLDAQMLCQICYAAPRNTKFNACNHHLTCKSCATQLIKSANPVCPICRVDITAGFSDCAIDEPTFAAFRREDSEGSLNAHSQGSSGEFRNMCMICMSAPKDARFDCGHSCTCAGCAQLILAQSPNCPLCRARVTAAHPCSAGEATYADLNQASQRNTRRRRGGRR